MNNLIIPKIEISLKYKNKVKLSELFQIQSSKDCHIAFRSVFDADTFYWTEEMILLCLNRANRVVGFYKVSGGGTAGTYVDAKVIFTIALKCSASAIIIAHNHPSGNLKPSQADKDVTKKIKEAGKLLDIQLLDHLILAEQNYLSFADEGLL